MISIWNHAGIAGTGNSTASQNPAPKPGNGTANRFAAISQGSRPQGPGLSRAGAQLPFNSAPASTAAGQGRSARASGRDLPAAANDSSSNTSDDAGATITANDFLTLLVTEMQNQDPTADVDPNSYIDQLVQVNSLEQLISINQNLETVLGTASTQSSSSEASGTGASASLLHGKASGTAGKVSAAPMAAHHSASASAPSRAASRGNLSVPQATSASRTVAHSLDGAARPGAGRHAIRDIPTRPLQR